MAELDNSFKCVSRVVSSDILRLLSNEYSIPRSKFYKASV